MKVPGLAEIFSNYLRVIRAPCSLILNKQMFVHFDCDFLLFGGVKDRNTYILFIFFLHFDKRNQFIFFFFHVLGILFLPVHSGCFRVDAEERPLFAENDHILPQPVFLFFFFTHWRLYKRFQGLNCILIRGEGRNINLL